MKGGLRILLKERRQTFERSNLPLPEKLGFDIMLAAQFRLTGGATQEFEDNLGFELGGKRPTRTRHDRISLRGPVKSTLLVQRKGRTTRHRQKGTQARPDAERNLASFEPQPF